MNEGSNQRPLLLVHHPFLLPMFITCVCAAAGCAAGGPATPANAVTFNCKASAAGANCPTSCKPGYQLAAANGNLISTCVKGNWTEVLGTCLEMGEQCVMLCYVMLHHMLHQTRNRNPIRSQGEAHLVKGTQSIATLLQIAT
jgi:hypothetical protein